MSLIDFQSLKDGVKKACMFGRGVDERGTRPSYCSADSGAVLAVDRHARALCV